MKILFAFVTNNCDIIIYKQNRLEDIENIAD